jgi:6-phosphogluconate dehydrogenase
MKIGIIGLGKMGNAVAFRFIKAGYRVVGFDTNQQARQQFLALGGELVDRVDGIVQQTTVIWLMLPAGTIIDSVLEQLRPSFKPGVIFVDGGNSHFSDSVRRAKELACINCVLLDCGTSGGIQGRDAGFSMMIGGDRESFLNIEALFKVLAVPQGYAYVGPSGAGHYVKMVHNGIEYALLESYAEGFSLLKNGSYPHLDLEMITSVWNHGAVIRSWILELANALFKHDQEFKNISGEIGANGTGLWTVQEAHEKNIPVPLIEDSVKIREWSTRTGGNYTTKIIALLRNQFGGHAVKNSVKE